MFIPYFSVRPYVTTVLLPAFKQSMQNRSLLLQLSRKSKILLIFHNILLITANKQTKNEQIACNASVKSIKNLLSLKES